MAAGYKCDVCQTLESGFPTAVLNIVDCGASEGLDWHRGMDLELCFDCWAGLIQYTKDRRVASVEAPVSGS